MRIALTGSSGLVGSELIRSFASSGDTITRVTRRRDRAGRDTAYWNPDTVEMDERGFEGHDVVIHLAGESLFGPWTKGRKERIRRSRVQGTELLAAGLASLDRPPRLLISASGIHYYAPQPAHERLDERSPSGSGYLAGVVRGWEAAAEPAEVAGIRTVQFRFGLVVARQGGLVQKMLPAFRLGLGAVVGPGDQAWSWVALPEIPHIVRHVIATAALRGAVNVTSPNAVTSSEFSHALGRVLHRPVPLHIPTAIIARLPGGMGHELAMKSANVLPKRLLDSGYDFRMPHLEPALRQVLATD